MINISRRCIPFTPYDKDLATATVTLVSATGVYVEGQDPFPTEDPGDATFREIAADTPNEQLRIAHHHYDHSEADTDPNIVFPLATLHELQSRGVIGAVHPVHYSYGFTTRSKELYETTFVQIADKLDRSKTRLVVLTAGCPETCHRSVGNLAREIESRGIPTIVIAASPAATESVRAPRIVSWEGVSIGRVVGPAGDRQQHARIVTAALEMFTRDMPPGRTVMI